jgi:flagellar biosynthesis protein FlhA
MVIVNDLKLAFALEYSPGNTPIVLACARGKSAAELIFKAQQLDIPLIEVTTLEDSDIERLVVGHEIPEECYRPVAQALALLYKSQPSPGMVRFLRLIDTNHKRKKAPTPTEEFEDILATPALYVEVGEGIYGYRSDLQEPLDHLRQRIAMEIGLALPPVPLRLHPRLAPTQYAIKLRDIAVCEGEIELPIDSTERLYLLVNRVKQIVFEQGWELLGYHEVHSHVEMVRKHNASLVDAIFPHNFSLSGLRQILRNLLREQLSIRDLSAILEVILDNLQRSQDPELLTECVRMAYSRSLCHKYQDAEGYLNALLFEPEVERVILSALKETGGVRWLDLPPDDMLRVLRAIESALKRTGVISTPPVLLTSPVLRRFLRRLTEHVFADLAVLSYNEIAPLTEVRSLGVVSF